MLSERSGVAEATIYNFYSGANKLGLLVLQSIAKAFEVSEWYLLGLTDDPKDFLDPNLTITNAGEHAVNDEKNAAEQKIRAIVALLSVEEAKEAASLLERLYTGRTAPGHARPARPRN